MPLHEYADVNSAWELRKLEARKMLSYGSFICPNAESEKILGVLEKR